MKEKRNKVNITKKCIVSEWGGEEQEIYCFLLWIISKNSNSYKVIKLSTRPKIHAFQVQETCIYREYTGHILTKN